MFGKKKPRLLTLSVIISTLLFACTDNNSSENSEIEGVVIQGNTQGTTYSIIIAEERSAISKHQIDSILAVFDTVLSTYMADSWISKLNATDASFAFSDPTGFFKNCYQQSLQAYTESSGAFDPSVFPLVSGWGFFQKMETPLDQNEVDSIRQFVSFEVNKLHSVRFEDDSIFFSKKDPRFKLDFNAIAQGYAVDVLYDFIHSKGHRNFYVEIGGELRVTGHNREKKPWKIGVDKPEAMASSDGTREISGIISITDKAIATSGNYRNFYEKDGKKYAHSLDPSTGFPVEHNLLSATVIADNCARADAYATACMVLGTEKAKDFVKQLQPAVEIILIYEENGKFVTYTSKGAEKYFE